jgi:predicted Ser/Thr protein kinase
MTFHLAKIYIEDDKVRKVFKDSKRGQEKFYKELFFYFHADKYNLDYVPNLIHYDNETFTIELSNVGQSLDKLYYRKSKRHLNKIIQDLHQKLYDDSAIFHNDIRYKNVCFKDGKYYLIDFENQDFKFKDKNTDNILNETYISDFCVSQPP